MTERIHLPGGSGGVWYEEHPEFGPVVHRPTGPWTAAVHDLLRFVAAAGLEGVPRVFGFDEDGREILSYLPGEALDPGVREPADTTIADAASWLRRYHDIVRAWRPGPRAWRQTSADPAPGQLVCHNDAGTYNWIVDGARFAGLIDWDQAGPGAPLDDLAFLCWTAAPLVSPAPAEHAARRLRIAAESYGGVEPVDLLDAVAARLRRAVERISAGIDRGDPGMLALRDHGEPDRTRRALDGFAERMPALRAALASV